MKATAKAYTNIALIKYWGKRDESLFLPMNSSLSITLDKFYTITTVQFCPWLNEDIFILNKVIAGETETLKVSQFLNRIREISGKETHAIVQSTNRVPTASGFASSASGFAALAAAAARAIGLELGETELSQLARQGSGSACRSIFGGYVEWKKGRNEDGTDSYGVPIEEKQTWNLSILSVLLTAEQKQVSSREGMKRTVETSPFYSSWVREAEKDLLIAKAAIKERNFKKLGQTIEANALKMHATTLGAKPPFFYWQSATVEVMGQVQALRSSGIEAYFTIDAGPNVKVLCQPEDEQVVRDKLLSIPSVRDVYMCHPGPGVTYLSDSLS
ncbi:diphosphomevalonate decarboxylase [Bacillus sp. DX4.1]|uniref:diphosphomevalonate decarboxylase n=1 Tax=Bacillus sp. DX4.1 TaxID=3055867 RepID=UPI0025A1711A|nr:diphosphomevalonate decarboxylase [Bacillus sp. DX4.1]MDM5190764.1 diphosphomevalonate decarboxylase [Bacillus sp. DX4.1]